MRLREFGYNINEADASKEIDYNDPAWDEKVLSIKQKAELAKILKSKGKEPKVRWNPETRQYYVDYIDTDDDKSQLKEFAPGSGGGDAGNYFRELASAWYNGAYDSGSLQKGIKSKEDVERLLQRGVVAPDGVTRKFGIDYNAEFDGVVISSDDYYEHSDHGKKPGTMIDTRTGQAWGPYDYMEFSDDDLSESVNPGMAEDDDAVAAFLARGGEIQQLKPQRGPKRSGVGFASKHIGSGSGRGTTKGQVSGLGANTGKAGKPVVTAEQDMAEGNEWQGNRGNSQAGMTDHTFDEAKQYIKGNYPFYRTYNVSRVEPGMRYHANPEKVANKTQSLVKGIDSALDYLQVKQNPMMSGSTQVTPSIGYSWHTHESRANGIAVLYYEDRGMGNDTITIAAKDQNNLKGAVQVCRDAGVIPLPKVKEQGVAEDNLKEFAPGPGGGESGRWYTDDQMTDLVGDGWWNDLDISGEVSKQEMIQEAQAWLDDQGYSVHVLNCKVNDDDMEWFIEGSFQNSGFAKKGMAENTAAGINKMFNNLGDPVYANLQRVALLAMQGRQQEAHGRLNSVIKDASPQVQKKIIDAVNVIKPVTVNGRVADSSTLDKSKAHQDWILNTFIPWVQSLLGQQVAEDQLDELSKDTLRNYVRAQPARIKGPAGLATTDNQKAARIVDPVTGDIRRAMNKYKDPEYGQQKPRLPEDSLAAMRRLAGVTTPLPAAVPNGPRQYRHMPTAVQPR